MEHVRRDGYYHDFNVRIANDVVKYGAMYHVMGVGAVCDMMDKYGCNDSHLTTVISRWNNCGGWLHAVGGVFHDWRGNREQEQITFKRIAMPTNYNDYEVYRDLGELAEVEFEEFLAEL